MTNEVSVFGKPMSLSNTDQLMKALEDTQDEGASNGDVSYLSFSGKRGTYKLGKEGRSPGEDELFLVAIPSFELGWICWKGGKPVSKKMANISQPKIPEPDHSENGPFDANKGEGWHKARAFVCRSIDTDEQVYFSNNSVSGVAEMADLQREVVSRMRSGLPCWPAITFGAEEFEAQGFKNSKPLMPVQHWVSTETVELMAEEGADIYALVTGGEPEKIEEEQEAPRPQRRRL